MPSSNYFWVKKTNFYFDWLILLIKEHDEKKGEGIINNRYRKIKSLGHGSQGTVFQVEDTKDNNKM